MAEEDIDQTSSDEAQSDDMRRYMAEIRLYEQEAGPWERRGKKIIKRYKNERSDNDKQRRLNVLWSNIQTMGPALYMRDPKADISRRFSASGDVSRCAADVLEKCVSYFVAEARFGSAMRKAVRQYMLPGRGTIWARYVPHMHRVDLEDSGESKAADIEAAEITDSADTDDAVDEVEWEEVAIDFVHFEDFGHNVARVWDEVYLVWRRVFLDRQELKERFPKVGGQIPLDYKTEKLNEQERAVYGGRATIYEGWDKNRGVAFWLHKDMPELLDVREDPLKIEGFFPTPEPLLANLADDSLIPTPDYTQWQDQAMELDDLKARSSSIAKSLKVAGVYDASAPGVERLLSEGVQNTLIPVERWAVFAEKGGLKGAMALLPMEEIAQTLLHIYEAQDKVKQELYEISGFADIIRGASDPDETYGAQKIKSNFATLRLDDKQRQVHEYSRDVVRIIGEIIANHFQLDTIKTISGVKLIDLEEASKIAGIPLPTKQAAIMFFQQRSDLVQQLFPDADPDELQEIIAEPTWQDVMKLMRDEPARRFRLDIETKSTIKEDEQEEKQARVEFLMAVSGFLKQAMEATVQQPLLLPLMSRLLMFGVRAFPVGKDLEEAFKLTIAKLEKQAANPQQKPDPKMAEVQGKLQLQQQAQQADQQREQARVQADAALEQQRMRNEQAMEAMRLQYQRQADADAQKWQQWQFEQQSRVGLAAKQQEMRMEAALEQMKQQMTQQTQILLAHIKAAAQIESARVSAARDDGAAAYAREAAGEG
jgi:hypothetical protein